MSRERVSSLENPAHEAESLHARVLRSQMAEGKSLDQAYEELRQEAEATDPRYDRFRDRTLAELLRAYEYLKKLV